MWGFLEECRFQIDISSEILAMEQLGRFHLTNFIALRPSLVLKQHKNLHFMYLLVVPTELVAICPSFYLYFIITFHFFFWIKRH